MTAKYENKERIDQLANAKAIGAIEILTQRMKRRKLSTEQYRQQVMDALSMLDGKMSYTEYLRHIGQVD